MSAYDVILRWSDNARFAGGFWSIDVQPPEARLFRLLCFRDDDGFNVSLYQLVDGHWRCDQERLTLDQLMFWALASVAPTSSTGDAQ